MGPPKLQLVSQDGGAQTLPDPESEDNELASADALDVSDRAHENAAGKVECDSDLESGPNIAAIPSSDRQQKVRTIEALLFASSKPLDVKDFAEHLDDGDDIVSLIAELQTFYDGRGVNLVRVAGKWTFQTAGDLSHLLERHAVEQRRLSKAALETLAIIAYHQPVTRAEIEEIRGVTTSKGSIDVLLETGWIRPRGRRRAPGRPLTYGTTEQFLTHFTLDNIKDLPGLQELKGAGLLDSNLPANFTMPDPTDVAALMPDELALDADNEDDEAAQEDLDLLLPEDEPADKSETTGE